MEDEAFLTLQGVLSQDMEKIKRDAKENKYSVFHQFCENEYEKFDSKYELIWSSVSILATTLILLFQIQSLINSNNLYIITCE